MYRYPVIRSANTCLFTHEMSILYVVAYFSLLASPIRTLTDLYHIHYIILFV